MQNKAVTALLTTLLVAPVGAQAEMKVYGKVHLNAGAYEESENGSTLEDNFQVNSYASRFGVKGHQDISDSLKATYKLEWEVNPDSDNEDDTAGFARRNQYIGLKGGFGEFRFGRHDTPLKSVQGKFDQFGDTLADLKHAGDEDGENRKDNTLMYLGKAGAFHFAAAFIPGEGDGETQGDGVADTISASVAFNSDTLYIGVAADSYDDSAGQDENALVRLVGIYELGNMQFGLLAQSGVEAADDEDAKEDWLGFSFNSKVGGGNKIKFQYIQVEDSADTAKEGRLIGVGFDHKLGKHANIYALYTSLEEEVGSDTTLEVDSISTGYVLKF